MEELRKLLYTLDSSTIQELLTSTSEVRLNDYGEIAGGYRLSSLALQQLCAATTAGLHNVVLDVGGLRCTANEISRWVSPKAAIRIINDCVGLRFYMPGGKSLEGRKLIKNSHTRLVDGIVGPSYKYLPNHQLLDVAIDMLAVADPPAVFSDAILVGRRLGMAFITKEPIWIANLGHHENYAYHGGYYFSNSEAGECSVRAAPVLQLAGTPCRALGSMKHLAHAGKKFNKKLGRILAGIIWSSAQWRDVAIRANDHSLRCSLGGAAIKSVDQRQLRVAQIAERLYQGGVGNSAAQLLALAAVSNKPMDYRTDGMLRRSQELQDKCIYDLFLRMIGMADRMCLKDREALEHVAYKVVTGILRV